MDTFFGQSTSPQGGANGNGDSQTTQSTTSTPSFSDTDNSSARGTGGSRLPVRRVDLDKISAEVLVYIPEESARLYGIVPLGVVDGALEAGIVDPDNLEARDVLNFISSKNKLPYKLYAISQQEYEKVLELYQNLSHEVGQALEAFSGDADISEDIKALDQATANIGKKPAGDEGESTIVEDAPVTKIVATILRYATDGDASDIHIEPMAERVRVRFRVDGILHTSLFLPKPVHASVVARVKVLSNIKLDEKRKPQDGRFSARITGRKVDLRVSTFPSSNGEKVVIRILDQEQGIRSLEDLGLRASDVEKIDHAITRPYGMILISGPTGSGKSTTLYAMLQKIDREQKNVISLEDPVEYNIDGVAQSQVMPAIGYTFASGLRSILRQDPDIIMVGEIRDKETAQLAVQAALTGHLVLSTIHTNSAIGAIPRLVDMGVDPFLIAPTLNLVIGQRLVRMFCPGGGEALKSEESIGKRFDEQFADMPEQFHSQIPTSRTVYKATPTNDCPGGTRGRMAVMETLPMTPELEQVILKDPTEPALYDVARKQGLFTMQEDALIKAVERKIPFEEVQLL